MVVWKTSFETLSLPYLNWREERGHEVNKVPPTASEILACPSLTTRPRKCKHKTEYVSSRKASFRKTSSAFESPTAKHKTVMLLIFEKLN